MVEAEHMCMTMRGIKKPGSKTITTVAKGLYKEDREERREILSLMCDFQSYMFIGKHEIAGKVCIMGILNVTPDSSQMCGRF